MLEIGSYTSAAQLFFGESWHNLKIDYAKMGLTRLMSVPLWNFKEGGVLKCKIFAQESTCSKEIVLKQSCD